MKKLNLQTGVLSIIILLAAFTRIMPHPPNFSPMAAIGLFGAAHFAKKWQEKGAIPYGPFVRNGTNCSRFVATISRKAEPSFLKKLRLKFPFTISPSPKRNVSIANTNYYIVREHKCIKINRNTLKAYFSGIEKKDE